MLNKWQIQLDQCLPSTARNNLPKQIELFCYPDVGFVNLQKINLYHRMKSAEEFTFVLTKENGDRTFGFCRRILQSSKIDNPRYDVKPRLPETLCILSSFPYFNIFNMLLKTIQIRRWLTPSAVAPLLRDLYNKKIPPPATSFTVQRMIFFRPVEERLPPLPNGINCLLSNFKPKMLRYLISAILCERRMLFISNSLETLSNCIHGLLSLCYPFIWTHILVPYLPSELIDYVCAPSPYLIGLNRNDATTINRMPIGEVYFVDIDNGTMRATDNTPDIHPIGDSNVNNEFSVRRGSSGLNASQHFVKELEHLYSKAFDPNSLNDGIVNANSNGTNGDKSNSNARRSNRSSSTNRSNTLSLKRKSHYQFDCLQLSECFIVYFIQIFANYRQFLGTALRDKRRYNFDKHAFLRSHSNDPALHAFLKDFLGTNTFELFLQTRFEFDKQSGPNNNANQNVARNRSGSTNLFAAMYDISNNNNNNDIISNENASKGFFDKQVHIVQLKRGDCSYQSIKRSVQAMVEVESSGSNANGGKNNVTGSKLRDILMDMTSNRSSKHNKKLALNHFINSSYEANSQPIIMEVIFKRLGHAQGKDWRHGYKALCLLECLLQQASEAVIADTLNASRLLYVFMKYRANEAKDAVMLKALNVMSIYDGDNKGRGEKIRTQAALTFKLANDCNFMRAIRQRFARPSRIWKVDEFYETKRCENIGVYTLKTGDDNNARGMAMNNSSSMAAKIKFGVKFGVKAIKKEMKKQLQGKKDKSFKNKRVVVRAPKFNVIHDFFTNDIRQSYAQNLPPFLPILAKKKPNIRHHHHHQQQQHAKNNNVDFFSMTDTNKDNNNNNNNKNNSKGIVDDLLGLDLMSSNNNSNIPSQNNSSGNFTNNSNSNPFNTFATSTTNVVAPPSLPVPPLVKNKNDELQPRNSFSAAFDANGDFDFDQFGEGDSI